MIQKEMKDKQKRNQRKIISCNSVKSDYFDNLRNQTKKYSEALSYKKKLDKGEIEEKDIPDELKTDRVGERGSFEKILVIIYKLLI